MKPSALALFAVVTISCQCGGPGNGGTGGGGAGGGTGGGGGGEAPVSIAVTPADATYTTDGVTAATAVYTATATYAGGRTEDISAVATFGLVDFALGSFTGSTFTSTLAQGGRTTVRATFRGVEGNTSLTLRYQRQLTDPGSMNIPANPGTKFTGTATPARAPDLVYPNDGVLLPPNLSRLEVHFLPGAGNTLFELSLTSTFTDVKIYLRCAQPLNGGCIYLPDPAAWTALAISNRGTAPVTLRLKGTDDTGAEVGESGELKVSFSNDALQGGLYYWTTTAKAIMRFDFASATQMTAEKFVDSAIANNPSGCVGCHALSRDGKKMVVEAEGAFDGRIAIVDVASSTTTTPFPTQNKSFFESWNPDGTAFVGVDDRGSDFNLRVFDGTTGALIESIADTGTAARPTDHPDWSADGNTIAYSSVTREGPRGVSLQWATKGAVRIVQRPSGGTWGMPIEVAPWVSGKHRYYPAIAPSNEYLVFNESTCGSGEADIECDSDTDPDARLFAAKLMPMAPLVELKRANAPGKRDGANTRLASSFPKWSPFNFQRSVELGSRLHWVTFSSARAYGLRDPGALTWLWMVAVDPDKVVPTDDPSYPAFCLPFQDLATSNHIAQWATVVVPPIQ